MIKSSIDTSALVVSDPDGMLAGPRSGSVSPERGDQPPQVTLFRRAHAIAVPLLALFVLTAAAPHRAPAHDALADYVLHRAEIGVAGHRIEVTLTLTFFEDSSQRERRLDLTATPPRIDTVGVLEQPGATGALLLHITAGGEGLKFATAVRDFAEQPQRGWGSLVTVEAAAAGETLAVVGFDHLPVGRTTLLMDFRRPGKGNIRLPLDVVTPSPGRLKLTVLSDDTGQPTPAMVRLTSRVDGRARPPANAIDFAPQFDSNGKATAERVAYLPGARKGSFWCMPGPVDMTLSPGVWEIAVGRGFEHTPVFEEVTIRSGEKVERTIRPKRWVNMSQRGWWSADDHVHGRLISDNDARNLIAWAIAEDVHLTNLVKMGDIYRTYFEQRGFGPEHRVAAGDYVLAPAQECPRTREMGHVLTMNLTDMVRDSDQYFLYDTVLDAVHRQGGLTGYAHAATGMFEVHRDMTLNVPRERIDFFEIHQFNNLGTDLYYEFLNLGCKVIASAGSDLPWGGTIGETRVYSYLGGQPFSADRWFEAFGRGRTFVTSGPMLELTVADALPGDEVRVKPGQRLRVRARAWADPNLPAPVRLEIVRHGDIIRATESKDPQRPEAALDFEIDAADGFWIAARARTGGGTSAHTTPVYVVRDGLRFWKHNAADEIIARRLASLDQIERLVAEVRAQDQGIRFGGDSNRKQLAVQGPQLLERVFAARRLYEELKKTAVAERSRRAPQRAPVQSDPAGWVPIIEQTFPVADEFPRWRREGPADVSVTMERTLLIETHRGYVGGVETAAATLWFDAPTPGDVRFEFDAAADPRTRCAFVFNARPQGTRLAAFHAIDILRDDNVVTLRHFESPASAALAIGLPPWSKDATEHEPLGNVLAQAKVLAETASPFRGADRERVYHFDIRVTGGRVTVLVDGARVFDVPGALRHDERTRGGYFGFHNEGPGDLSFDNLRVYRSVGLP